MNANENLIGRADIAIGESPNVERPQPWSSILIALFVGLLLVGFLRGPLMKRLRGGQSGPQWPNPQTGQKSLWDRLRGR